METPNRIAAPVPLKGSDRAINRVRALIDEWQSARTGCLEPLAEWMMTHAGATLDEGLAAMREAGLIHDWAATAQTPPDEKAVDTENRSRWRTARPNKAR